MCLPVALWHSHIKELIDCTQQCIHCVVVVFYGDLVCNIEESVSVSIVIHS